MENENNIYKEKSRSAFDKIASNYSESHDGKFVEPMYEEVIKRILELKPRNILDVGCGPGSVLVHLKNKNIGLHGLDISEKMIEEAEKNLGQDVDLRVGDSESMPWLDNSFDIILCNASFHHYPNPLKSLKEMKRLLKKDGVLIIGEPTAPSIIRFITNMSIKYSNKGDVRIYNKKEMESLLEEVGLHPYNYKKINHKSFIINANII